MRTIISVVFIFTLILNSIGQVAYEYDVHIDNLNDDAENLYLKCQSISNVKYGSVIYYDDANNILYCKKIVKPFLSDDSKNKFLFEYFYFLIVTENKVQFKIRDIICFERKYYGMPVFMKESIIKSSTDPGNYFREKYRLLSDVFGFGAGEHKRLMKSLNAIILKDIQNIEALLNEPLIKP